MNHMNHALSLAKRALGSVSPNPAVGAVVVKNGCVVGEGWTQPPGQPHAEIMALRQAAGNAVGGTLYSTLEPCNHHGKTPPCTQAILAAGIETIHVSIRDPNPGVVGGGFDLLKRSGMNATEGDCAEDVSTLMEAYLKHVTKGIPFVTAKFAISLDGKIATRCGDSKWISSEESRRYANGMRSLSDAVMVGINTVLVDDPKLTARDDRNRPLLNQPLRVIVDSRGRIPRDAQVFSNQGDLVLAVAAIQELERKALVDMMVGVEVAPADDGSVDLEEILRRLGARGITSVLVEGGAILLGSLFDHKLVDKVVAWVAPTVIGGSDAPTAVKGSGVKSMTDALRLKRVDIQNIGCDVVITGYS